jgi:2-polyprenyl-3-methyl-5-hydroxy-6-metoxy-1,4-benzoquinol methylase
MRRIIEELIAQRKEKQDRLKKTLERLADLIEKRGVLNRQKGKISQALSTLNTDLNELITLQDKEWDAYSNNHATMVFKSLHWKIEKLEAEYANVKSLLANFIQLEKSLQNLIEAIDKKRDEQTVNRLKEIRSRLSVYQYSDFEQRFRGNEEEIKEKLKQYLPIFSDHDSILDIGCGRGEFVELLAEQGKTVKGIDISESMLKIAEEKGLPCRKHDALAFLKDQDAQCLGGIFSAQVIEHFPPEYLRDVVNESFRVLKNGSPILLETINPLCLFALSNIYFLDTTHQKPLHPEYMRYLLESSGFSQVEVLYPEALADERLEEITPEHPLARAFNTNVDKLNHLLFSSPNYAIKGVR